MTAQVTPGKAITVADVVELASLHVSELQEGAVAWVQNPGAYYTLEKESGQPVSPTVIAPGLGAPTAGAADARWIAGEAPGASAVLQWKAAQLGPLQNYRNNTLVYTDVVAVPMTLSEGSSVLACVSCIGETDDITVTPSLRLWESVDSVAWGEWAFQIGGVPPNPSPPPGFPAPYNGGMRNRLYLATGAFQVLAGPFVAGTYSFHAQAASGLFAVTIGFRRKDIGPKDASFLLTLMEMGPQGP